MQAEDLYRPVRKSDSRDDIDISEEDIERLPENNPDELPIDI